METLREMLKCESCLFCEIKQLRDNREVGIAREAGLDFKSMAAFPTYLLKPEKVEEFKTLLNREGFGFLKTKDEMIPAQKSHYTEYEVYSKEGVKLLFWVESDPHAEDVTLTIGNPSGRKGKEPLRLTLELLNPLGRCLNHER